MKNPKILFFHYLKKRILVCNKLILKLSKMVEFFNINNIK